ncbi:hypothetical protein CDAR_441361 [Caerostris darwini]|uniref:Uncharacterized protein n=1 Tax=Caerostris darwini TaxID=1538125 RepID=A0AAV4TRU7_9ARAC|nr:hypothetical protein CDAR_441361 [Caerostris darwini]
MEMLAKESCCVARMPDELAPDHANDGKGLFKIRMERAPNDRRPDNELRLIEPPNGFCGYWSSDRRNAVLFKHKQIGCWGIVWIVPVSMDVLSLVCLSASLGAIVWIVSDNSREDSQLYQPVAASQEKFHGKRPCSTLCSSAHPCLRKRKKHFPVIDSFFTCV